MDDIITEATPPAKKSGVPTFLKWGCGGILGIAVIIIIIALLIPKSAMDRVAKEMAEQHRKDSLDKIESVARQSAARDSMAKSGVMISTDSLEHFLSNNQYFKIFEERTLNTGKKAYDIKFNDDDRHAMLECVGNKTNPESIVIIGYLGTDSDVNATTAEMMGLLSRAIDSSSVHWIAGVIGKLVLQKGKEPTKVFGKRKVTVSGTIGEQLGYIAITFTPA